MNIHKNRSEQFLHILFFEFSHRQACFSIAEIIVNQGFNLGINRAFFLPAFQVLQLLLNSLQQRLSHML